MMKQCNLVEFFSGIGSQAKALRNLEIKVNTLGTSEWDVHAIAAYDLIHNSVDIPEYIRCMEKQELLELLKEYTFSNSGKEPLDFESLRTYSKESLQRIYASIVRNHNYVDISALNGKDMPENIDILTYSFPCQDLSNVGAFHGYNKGIDKDSGSRSSLLWQVGRILTEMHDNGKRLPRFLLMENVPTLLSKRHVRNFNTWINDLKDLGYVSKYFPLNACSFGLPQNRPRLLMISVYVGSDSNLEALINTYFDHKTSDDIVEDYKRSRFYHQYKVQDLLRTNYDNRKIFEEAVECTPNNTVSRQKIWEENPQIVLPGYIFNESMDMVRTITTKQDRNPNSGNLYFESGIEGRSKFRYLTPRECMLFMGFSDTDYRQLKNNNIEFHKGDALFSRDKVIRMAGNSIPVKLLEGTFLQIIQLDDLIDEFEKHSSGNLFGDVRSEDYVTVVRGYLYSKGLRVRTWKKDWPTKADLIYPRYKTAVYIRSCFEFGHDCREGKKRVINKTVWDSIINSNRERDKADTDTLINQGWNVLLIWECALDISKRENSLNMIEKCIRENTGSKNEKGRVIICG